MATRSKDLKEVQKTLTSENDAWRNAVKLHDTEQDELEQARRIVNQCLNLLESRGIERND